MATVFGRSENRIEVFWEDESGKMFGKGVGSEELRIIQTKPRKSAFSLVSSAFSFLFSYFPKSGWILAFFVLFFVLICATVISWLEDEEDYIECKLVRGSSACRRKSLWKVFFHLCHNILNTFGLLMFLRSLLR